MVSVVAASVVATVMVMVGLTSLEHFTIESNGLSKDGSNCGSSNNECNGEFDVDHF